MYTVCRPTGQASLLRPSLFTCKDADPQTVSSAAVHDEYKCEEGENMHLSKQWGVVTSSNSVWRWIWDCTVKKVAAGDVAMATAALGQVGTLIEPGRGGKFLNRPKRGKNNWQAQPIKHEVECEGVQLHCSANILGTRIIILIWFCSSVT